MLLGKLRLPRSPETDWMKVRGFNPNILYGRYMDCVDAVADEYGHADVRAILAEMRTRDPLWLNGKSKCSVSKEPGAAPNSDEIKVAKLLTAHGFNVEFLAPSKEKYVKSPDAKLNGSIWEFKIPTANTEKTIKNQLKKALGKGTDKLLISNVANDMSLSDAKQRIEELFATGQFKEIAEVLLASDEELVRMKRKSRSR